jgi:uncharacterized protein
MKRILIAGGTGFIGKKLAETLYAEGHTVTLLSRNPSNNNKFQTFIWEPSKGVIDLQALKDTDIIINLAGSGISKWPWTKKRKLSIYNSRILSTRLLVKSIIDNGYKPSLFVNVSATGYYGNRPGEKISELSPGGIGFLSRVCRDWENETLGLKDSGIPLTILRTGIVLSNNGGSLPVLVIPFKYGLNVIFNNGEHFIPWIHIDDLIKIFTEIVNESLLPGLYNAVSPNPVSQNSLNVNISKITKRKTIKINIPEKLIEFFAREMKTLITTDQFINPSHLLSQDFNFFFAEISDALKNLLGK